MRRTALGCGHKESGLKLVKLAICRDIQFVQDFAGKEACYHSYQKHHILVTMAIVSILSHSLWKVCYRHQRLKLRYPFLFISALNLRRKPAIKN